MLITFPKQFVIVFALLKKTQEYASLSLELNSQTENVKGQEEEIYLLSEKVSIFITKDNTLVIE